MYFNTNEPMFPGEGGGGGVEDNEKERVRGGRRRVKKTVTRVLVMPIKGLQTARRVYL